MPRCGMIVLCLVGVVILIINGLAHLKNFNLSTEIIIPRIKKTFRHIMKQSAGLSLVHASQFANETGFNCFNATVDKLRFPICAYSSEEDIYISQSLYLGGYFEKELVQKFIRLFRKHTNVTLIDIGANIGLYSLPISHLGRQVVAVEPNPDTYRRLAKSIHLGGVSSRIYAVNNAIADVDQSTAILQIDLRNRGNSFLTKNHSLCQPNCSVVVPTTTLDRLLPLMRNHKVVIKADVEGSEIKIFTETGAGLFFKTVNVPIIMMEWQTYPNYYKDESTRRMVYRFLEFFHSRNYEVYGAKTELKLSANWWTWPGDIILKKRGLPRDKLFSI